MLHSVPVLLYAKYATCVGPLNHQESLKNDSGLCFSFAFDFCFQWLPAKSSNILSHNLVKMQNSSDMITGCQPLIEHACNEIKSKITESVLHTILKISIQYGIVSGMIVFLSEYSHFWVICGWFTPKHIFIVVKTELSHLVKKNVCIACPQIFQSMGAAVWGSCTSWYQAWLYLWPSPCCSSSFACAETTRKPHVHQRHASPNPSVARTWRCPCSRPTNQRWDVTANRSELTLSDHLKFFSTKTCNFTCHPQSKR